MANGERFTVKAVSKKDGKTYYDEIGVAFPNMRDGELKSVKLILHMFPGLDLVIFPPKRTDQEQASE